MHHRFPQTTSNVLARPLSQAFDIVFPFVENYVIARIPNGRIECGRVPKSKRFVVLQEPLQFFFLRIDDVVIREGLETAQRLPMPVATLGANDTAAAKTEPFGENFWVQTASSFY